MFALREEQWDQPLPPLPWERRTEASHSGARAGLGGPEIESSQGQRVGLWAA